jgi:hypothetical protein
MSWSKSCAIAAAFVVSATPFQSAAQPTANAEPNRLIPVLHVFTIAGFKTQGHSRSVSAAMALLPAESRHKAVTLQSDTRGPCTNQLQAPAAPLGGHDATASAEWRVEATAVTSTGQEATVDVRWERRVPRPGVLLEGNMAQERRLVLRDGGRGILDVVRRAGDAAGVCDSFAIGVELRFQSLDDADVAGLGYDLWLIDRASGEAVARARAQATQGADATYAFAPQTLAGAAGAVSVSVSGTVTGRARKDGSIALTFDTSQGVLGPDGGRGAFGFKRILVGPGETIEFEMPEAQKAPLPPDLAQHDYALRVTIERLW